MPIQRLFRKDFATLENPGKRSEQIVSPQNAPEARVTITRVTMEPGPLSPRHFHSCAEQTWIVERGRWTLLLAQGETEEIEAGAVISANLPDSSAQTEPAHQYARSVQGAYASGPMARRSAGRS